MFFLVILVYQSAMGLGVARVIRTLAKICTGTQRYPHYISASTLA